jgi:hypothetical protein
MVAIINSGNSIRAAFMYNENKVEEGVADLILASNYPMELGDMKREHRLNMLLKTAANNDNVKRNSVHISLNFAPGEKLSQEVLTSIAAEYMQGIGFGGQPFLVYEHKDVAHQHLHIVTVKVRPDGRRIDMQNIGKVESQQTRKQLENKYGLVKAELSQQPLLDVKAVNAARVGYGKTQTKRAIYNVLCAVLKPYKYTSLAEVNAVLRLYNVTAERGSEGSRLHKHRGLLYRVLDGDGMPVGVPIKASLFPEMFPEKPTLNYIESRYIINETLRQPDKKRVKSVIDFALIHPDRTSIQDMIRELNGKGIAMVLRQNQDGLIYGITFIDHQTKAVFNGSDLGKQYSAKGISERCRAESSMHKSQQVNQFQSKEMPSADGKGKSFNIINSGDYDSYSRDENVLDDLLKVEYGADYLPGQWKSRRKRKRKSNSNNL